jgi:hypothetical protein
MPEIELTKSQAEPARRLKIESVSEGIAPIQCSAENLGDAQKHDASIQMLAAISALLLKRILDMQEVLEFYERNML